jgi:hypothetical protein
MKDFGHQSHCGHLADAGKLDQSTGFLPLWISGGLFATSGVPVSVKGPHVLQDEMKALKLVGNLSTQITAKLSPIACSEVSQSTG